MDDEFIGCVTVECDVIFGLDPGQRKNIGDAIGMKPHCAISWKLTYQVGPCYLGCTMDVHVLANLPDIS